MLTAFFIFSVLAAVLLVCGYIARNGLRAEVQRLKGHMITLASERDGLKRGYEDMKQIANEALNVANKREFPKPANRSTELPRICYEAFLDAEGYLPDPDPNEVKFCPKCSVSVRAIEWPQRCPACKTCFGDQLDATEIG